MTSLMNDIVSHVLVSDAVLQSSPGANLAATRQAYGLTVEQIANQLNLAPRQIVALEADDYAVLPAPAIARGFLRSYAKLLRLDPGLLMAMLPPASLPGEVLGNKRGKNHIVGSGNRHSHANAGEISTAKSASAAFAPIESHKKFALVAGVGALLVASAGLYAMGWLPEGLHRKRAIDGAVAGGQVDSGQDSSGAGALGTQASGNDAGGSRANPYPSLTIGASAPVNEVLPAVSIGVLEQSIDGSRLKSSAAPALANPLVLNMKKDSWVEIKRADNTAVVAKILKGGSVASFEVSEPLTLTIGNAAAIEASLRGVPLQIASVGNSTVVRMQLK